MLIVIDSVEGLNINAEQSDSALLKSLNDEIKILKNDLNEKNNLYIYAKAEIENIRKKYLLENVRLKKLIIEKLIGDIFLLTDSIEYGLCFEKLYDDNVELKKFDFFLGFRLVYEMLLVFFEKNEVKQLNPLGDDFNPSKHEAIMVKNIIDFTKKNVILEVIQKGYMYNDFVFRHAKVIISS